MRITGLGTGLEVDSIIKETMQGYRIKINQQHQKKDILEIKQKLYRDVMAESKNFYNKYLDILSSDSIISSSKWQSVKYDSTSNSVKVTGSTEAKADNYKITGQTATAAKKVVTKDELEVMKTSKVVIDGKDESGNDKLVTKNYLNINGKDYELIDGTLKDQAKYLNDKLKMDGVNISVRYSDFAGTLEGVNNNKSGFVFESTVLGKDSVFVIGGSEVTENIGGVAGFVDGINASGATVSGITFDSFKPIFSEDDTEETKKNISFSIKLGDNTYDLSVDVTSIHTNEDISALINKALSEKTETKDIITEIDPNNNNNIIFKTKTLGESAQKFSVTIGSNGTIESGAGINATYATRTVLGSELSGKISINNNVINVDDSLVTNEDKINYINSVLEKQGIKVKASLGSGDDVIFTSTIAGEIKNLDVKKMAADGSISDNGTEANITIKDGKGGVYTHTGNKNLIQLDGVTFNFSGEIPAEGITITGSTNVTDTKDKIVKLFNDYNSLIEKLNTLTTEKRNRNYSPLTADQKSELSEKEIELWESKVEQGQLYRDSDLTRISNSLKEAMRTIVSGTGLTLEKIGISPVADYSGTKNGTFKIDESKLTAALENNIDEVKNMFTKSAPTDPNLSSSQKYNQTGIFYRVKDILYSETMTNTSSLAKKAGIVGTSSVLTNSLSKSITRYERKIEDMEVAFSRKEQALYSKYASLETMMNNLNSQQSYLYQSLGMSTS